jgi:hypothetical protein
LHLIADNFATHKHPVVTAWLDKHPRFHLHYTPTSASWLHMVERLFRDTTTERLRSGVLASVPELVTARGMSLTTTSNPRLPPGPRARATSCRKSFAPTTASVPNRMQHDTGVRTNGDFGSGEARGSAPMTFGP